MFSPYDDFARQVNVAGMVARDCGDSHWQIRGGRYCVNFYPDAKRGPTLYVNATNEGIRGVTIADAIQAASNPLHKKHALRKTKRRRTRFYRKARRRLLFEHSRCNWCPRSLNEKTATLDHIIPLSKGGTNGLDNLTLACYDCNQNRRDSLPSRTEWQKLS